MSLKLDKQKCLNCGSTLDLQHRCHHCGKKEKHLKDDFERRYI